MEEYRQEMTVFRHKVGQIVTALIVTALLIFIGQLFPKDDFDVFMYCLAFGAFIYIPLIMLGVYNGKFARDVEEYNEKVQEHNDLIELRKLEK